MQTFIRTFKILLGVWLFWAPNLFADAFAGRDYRRDLGIDFPFDSEFEDFSGLTYNPGSNTLFVLNGKTAANAVIETTLIGDSVRTINLNGLDAVHPDVEAITWISSHTFAVALEGPAKMAVINLAPGVTSVSASEASFYSFPAEATGVQSLVYDPAEDVFYFANKKNPIKVYKAKLPSAVSQPMVVLESMELPVSFPAFNISDVALFSPLSKNLLVLSEESKKILELVFPRPVPGHQKGEVLSEFSLLDWPIPLPKGLAFDNIGRMYVTGPKASNTSEDDFNRFVSSPPFTSSGGPAVVSDLEAIKVNTSSVTLVLSVPPFSGTGTESHFFSFSYSVVSAEGPFVAATRGGERAVPTRRLEFDAIDLTPATRYWFSVKHSENLFNWSERSNIVSLVTRGLDGGSANRPPVAEAVVPAQVKSNHNGVAQVRVDATLSRDPDGDVITSYQWKEGDRILYSGAFPLVILEVSGTGNHSLTLTVLSVDGNNQTQAASKTFDVVVQSPLLTIGLSKYSFTRTRVAERIDPEGQFNELSGITFNAVENRFYVVDSDNDAIIKVDNDGIFISSISLKAFAVSSTINADPEAIVWMGGDRYLVALENQGKLLMFSITPDLSEVRPDNAIVFPLPAAFANNVESLAYDPVQDVIYVAQQREMIISKAKLDAAAKTVTILETLDVSRSLTAQGISDMAFVPRVSPYLLVLSTSPGKVMEVVHVDGIPGLPKGSVAGEFYFNFYDVPKPEGIAFDEKGRLYVVGERIGDVQGEDDFSRFDTTPSVPNIRPRPQLPSLRLIVTDADGNGVEPITFDASTSYDPDGFIISTEWEADGVVVGRFLGSKVAPFTHSFSIGEHQMKLTVRDDGQDSANVNVSITVVAKGANVPPVVVAEVPATVTADGSAKARISVDASGSYDPDADDEISGFLWKEGDKVHYQGGLARIPIDLVGIGDHQLVLSVTATTGDGQIQVSSRTFVVRVDAPSSGTGLSRFTFTKVSEIQDLDAAKRYEDFSGIAYNPTTQNFVVSNSKKNALLWVDRSGKASHVIDVAGLIPSGFTDTDVEAMTWINGDRFGFVMEGSNQLVVAPITAATRSLARSDVKIYDIPLDASDLKQVKSVAFNPIDETFVFVTENEMKVVVARIESSNDRLTALDTFSAKNIVTATNISDVALFPRISPHLLVLSGDQAKIMEVVYLKNIPGLSQGTVLGQVPLVATDIPKAEGLSFDHEGRLYVVGKKSSAVKGEKDLTWFQPSPSVPNSAPTLQSVPAVVKTWDFRGDGVEHFDFESFSPSDRDGMISSYEWSVDGSVVERGAGPEVPGLSVDLPNGNRVVKLAVWDDALSQTENSVQIQIRRRIALHGGSGGPTGFDRFSYSQDLFKEKVDVGALKEYSGLAFNPISRTLFLVEEEQDYLVETDLNGNIVGTPLRKIDLSSFRGNDLTQSAGPKAIAWMEGNTYAIVFEGKNQLAVVTVPPQARSLAKDQAVIYDLPETGASSVVGLAYVSKENAFYFVNSSDDQRLFKVQLNPNNKTLTVLDSWSLSEFLPGETISDLAYFPRLSDHLLMMIEAPAGRVVELVVADGADGARGTVLSDFGVVFNDIPKPRGFTFDHEGRLFIVGNRSSLVKGEHDFSRFVPTPVMPNAVPVANAGPVSRQVIDVGGNGKETVVIDASASVDPDGSLIDYEWHVDGTMVKSAVGRVVENLSHEFSLGDHSVLLKVRDDTQAVGQTQVTISVVGASANLPPVARAVVPAKVKADSLGRGRIFVDASASSDPESDPIIEYRWEDSGAVLSQSIFSTASLTLNGVGVHVVTMTVTSRSFSGALLSGTSSYSVLVEPRTPGQFQIEHGTYSIREDGGTLTIKVKRLQGSDGLVSVSVGPQEFEAAFDSDYVPVPRPESTPFPSNVQRLEFDQGETERLYTLSILNDAVFEPVERFFVRLISPTAGTSIGAVSVATVTITPDGDLPRVTVLNGSGGGLYNVGATVSISTVAEVGDKVFERWIVTTAGFELPNPLSPTTSFTMPALNISIRPNFVPKSTVNAPPVVSAGSDIVKGELPFIAFLNGSANDDGLPRGFLSSTWTVISGPGSVVFNNSNSLVTTVSFSSAGRYVLKLTVTDGLLESSDQVEVNMSVPVIDRDPIAMADVPSEVTAHSPADVSVNAGASFDPDGDPITEYVWKEGSNVLSQGANAQAAFQLNGAGVHTVSLTVRSLGASGAPKFGTSTYDIVVKMQSGGDGFAAFTYNQGYQKKDVDAAGTYKEFSGAAFNPITRTLFLTDKDEDAIVETSLQGNIQRVINLKALRGDKPSEAISPKAITWMGGTTYAVSLENKNELIVVNLTSDVTQITSANSDDYEYPDVGAGKITGLAYDFKDKSLYLANEDEDKTIFKTQLNTQAKTLTVLETMTNTSTFDGIGDITFVPRVTPHLIVVSTGGKIQELVLSGANKGRVLASKQLVYNDIPEPNGITFDHEGKMYVVGSRTSAVQGEKDFTRFDPTPGVTNQSPVANAGEANRTINDADGNGSEMVEINGSGSQDSDGTILDYEWLVDGVKAEGGFGVVGTFKPTLAVGNHTVTLKVRDDAQASAQVSVNVTVTPKTNVNTAPVVSAGSDQTITLPNNATLAGSVSDDGLPLGMTSSTWTQVSGPGVTSFTNRNNATTSASFSAAGTYVLRLTATDSALVSQDEVTVIVNPQSPTNSAPVVSAGSDITITLPNTASLAGSVSDDGLPMGMTSSTWTQVSGPGVTSFTNRNSATTSASFSAAGTYVLRLTATDSALVSQDEVTVIVNPQSPTNNAPVVSAGSDITITLPNTANLIGSVSDDGLPNPPGFVTVTWRMVSGPGVVNFTNMTSVNTTASFGTAGTYVLRLSASDGVLATSDEVSITVQNGGPVNNPPVPNPQSVVTHFQTPVAITLTAFDPEGDPLTYSYKGSPLNGFLSGTPPNVIYTPNVGFSGEDSFNFFVSDPFLSSLSSARVSITVLATPPSNSAPSVNVGPDLVVTLPNSASLAAAISDDRLPNPPGSMTVQWSSVVGPGPVSFTYPNSTRTSAIFSVPGTYVIRLEASDSLLNTVDDLIVTVNPAPSTNNAPVVSAGSDISVTLPNTANLVGSVSDDGLPLGMTSSTWTQVSGPGVTSFTNRNNATTTASFSAAGTYVLRLTATDSALVSQDEVTVVVNPQSPTNNAPVVSAGSDISVTLPNTANLVGSVSDDGLPNPPAQTTVAWSQVSGPGSVNFTNGSSANTTVNFSAAGTYVLRLTASDSVLSSFDEVSVTVNPALSGEGFARFTYNQGYQKKDVDGSGTYKEFSGAAFNPITRTLFLTDKDEDAIVETSLQGNIQRVIDLKSLRGDKPTEPVSPKAITWLGGTTYAVSLEDKNELIVVNLTADVTQITSANSDDYEYPDVGAGKITGLAYDFKDKSLYLANEDEDKTIFKTQLNTQAKTLTVLETMTNTSTFDGIGDITFVPRVTPHLIVVSTGGKIQELVLSGANKGRVLASKQLVYNDIPEPNGITFDHEGKMYVVGSRTSAVQGEKDFTRFDPTPGVTNQSPVANAGEPNRTINDADGNGSEMVEINGSASQDSDGTILDYEWLVDGVKAEGGFGVVGTFKPTLAVGNHTVTLKVRDDAQASAQVSVNVTVKASNGNRPPVARAQVPQRVSANSLNQSEVLVDASSSSDADGDTIVSYVWTEGPETLYEGIYATATLRLSGLGIHSLTLKVASDNGEGTLLTGTSHYSVTVVGPNQPPVARAVVPLSVQAGANGRRVVSVDASSSSDPDGDPIVDYRWTESSVLLSSGSNANASILLEGYGPHTVTLIVKAVGANNVEQIGTAEFVITLTPAQQFGDGFGRFVYNRVFGKKNLDPTEEKGEFSGIAFNPVSERMMVTEGEANQIFETTLEGELLRTIDISSWATLPETTNPESITWIEGNTYALSLEQMDQLAIVTIATGATSIARNQVQFISLPSKDAGNIKSLTYDPVEDVFYFINAADPIKIFKARINRQTSTLSVLDSIVLGAGFPGTEIRDVAYFPRVSPHLLVICSQPELKVMEVVVSDAFSPHRKGDVLSDMAVSNLDLPKPSGLTFDHFGRMYIVGERSSTVQGEFDFNRYDPQPSVPNIVPTVYAGPAFIQKTDEDQNGVELVSFDPSRTFDPDGRILSYQWLLDGVVVDSGSNRPTTVFTLQVPTGDHLVKLRVRDDALASSETEVRVSIIGGIGQAPEQAPPVARATLPPTVEGFVSASAFLIVDASQSFDPNGDPLIRYQWRDVTRNVVLSNRADAGATISIEGPGFHLLELLVESRVSESELQSSTATFLIELIDRSSLGNNPPNVSAVVPTVVIVGSEDRAQISVDASLSLDVDADPVIRYQWVYNRQHVLYDGPSPVTSFELKGIGYHQLTLVVYSQDRQGHIRSANADYPVKLIREPQNNPDLPWNAQLGGNGYKRVLARNFSFRQDDVTNPQGFQDFSGLTYNATTRTLFMIDNKRDVIFELDLDGSPIKPNKVNPRIIDMSALREPGRPYADAEAICWLHSDYFAILLEDQKQLVITRITKETAFIGSQNAAIPNIFSVYPLPTEMRGNTGMEGLAYIPEEDMFYISAEKNGKTIYKVQLVNNALVVRQVVNIDGLFVAGDISEIAYAPLVSPHLLVLSHESKKVMEVVVSDKLVQYEPGNVIGELSLVSYAIPQAEGMTFDHSGAMYIVGETVRGIDETDYNRFEPLDLIPNREPRAQIHVPFIDLNEPASNGHKVVTLDGLATFEDSRIIGYEWRLCRLLDSGLCVDDQLIQTHLTDPNNFSSFPRYLTTAIPGGTHMVSLRVTDDVYNVHTASAVIRIPYGPHPNVAFPYDPDRRGFSNSLNYVHPKSAVQQAEIVFVLNDMGQAEVTIYDSQLREVKILRSPTFPAGQYYQPWDLTNNNGESVASGTYFALIKVSNKISKEKIVVIR